LTADQILIDKMRTFLNMKTVNTGREDWNFLAQLVKSNLNKGYTGLKGLPVTFDSKLALERPGLVYINIWHPLVRLAYNALEQATLSDVETRVLRFYLKGTIPNVNGVYYFFMFYLNSNAMVSSNELTTVVLGVDGNFHEYLSSNFLKIINDYLGEESQESAIEYDWVLGQELKQKAYEVMANVKTNKETTEKQKNDSLIGIRRSALEKTYNVKIKHVKNRLINATDERIIRMYEGQLKNLENKQDMAIKELENKQKIAVSYEPVACGLVEL